MHYGNIFSPRYVQWRTINPLHLYREHARLIHEQPDEDAELQTSLHPTVGSPNIWFYRLGEIKQGGADLEKADRSIIKDSERISSCMWCRHEPNKCLHNVLLRGLFCKNIISLMYYDILLCFLRSAGGRSALCCWNGQRSFWIKLFTGKESNVQSLNGDCVTYFMWVREHQTDNKTLASSSSWSVLTPKRGIDVLERLELWDSFLTPLMWLIGLSFRVGDGISTSFCLSAGRRENTNTNIRINCFYLPTKVTNTSVWTEIRFRSRSPRKVLEMYSDTWLPERLISDRCDSSLFSILLNCGRVRRKHRNNSAPQFTAWTNTLVSVLWMWS